jgi:predicted PurR-regulated permease PerM
VAKSESSDPGSRFARNVAIAIVLVALAVFVWKIAAVLLLVFAAIVFAAVIRSAATPLARRSGLPDAWAVGLVAFVLAAAILGALYLFGRHVLMQTEELWTALQGAWAKLQARFGDLPLVAAALEHGRTAFGAAADGDTVSKVAKGTFTAFGAIGDLVLVAFLAVYLAADPATYRNGLLLLVPRDLRPRVSAALDAAGSALRKWLVGQLGAMLFVGVLTTLGLWIAGVPMAIALGILSGVLDFVPVVGPMIAAIPGLVIAFAQGPEVALWAAAVYLTVQFVEGHLVIPIAQKWAVQMPPALALVAIVGFGLVFGLPGVLFALPLAVVTMVLVNKLYVERIA